MKRTLWILIHLHLLILGGCATSLTITSSPPEVTIYEGDNKLGVTPLEVNSEKVKTTVANGYLLRLEREGFHRVWLWVPNGIRGMNVVVNLQPFTRTETETKETKIMARAEIDGVSAKVLDLQSQLLLKGSVPDEALADLLTGYPEVGAVHYLAAVNHLRKGAKPEAAQAAKKALSFAPGEPDYVVLYRELGGDPNATEDKEAVPPAPSPATKGG